MSTIFTDQLPSFHVFRIFNSLAFKYTLLSLHWWIFYVYKWPIILCLIPVYFHCYNRVCLAQLVYYYMFLTYSTSYCPFSKLSDLCNLHECMSFCFNDWCFEQILFKPQSWKTNKRCVEDWGPLRCNALTLGDWFLLFQRNTVLSAPWRQEDPLTHNIASCHRRNESSGMQLWETQILHQERCYCSCFLNKFLF